MAPDHVEWRLDPFELEFNGSLEQWIGLTAKPPQETGRFLVAISLVAFARAGSAFIPTKFAFATLNKAL